MNIWNKLKEWHWNAPLTPLMPPEKPNRPERCAPWHDLSEAELAPLRDDVNCPYCGSRLFQGPAAGGSQNVLCGDEFDKDCGAKFNLHDMGQFGGQFIGYGDRA